METVHALALDREGRLWVGTSGGAHCLVDGQQITLRGLATNEIRAVCQTSDGVMWFGTKGHGVERWFQGELQRVTIADGLCDDRVFTFHEDADGFLWIGTHNGLSRISLAEFRANGPRHIHNFTTANGLLDNLINHILEDDDGSLWLSCNRGIFRIARAELNAVAAGRQTEAACAVFGTADGLPSSETNGEHGPAGCKARDGRLWFPTTQGVAVIDPKQLNQQEQPPPVVIEQVKADDEIIYGDGATTNSSSVNKAAAETQGHRLGVGGLIHRAVAPTLELPPGRARVLEIHYTANSFADSSRVRFKYRLEGHDRDWQYDNANRRVAFYTNLRPGRYVFDVTACNNHGCWNEHPVQFSFSVAPHFYETWPFYVACGVGLFGLAAGIQRYRLLWQHRLLKLEQKQALVDERARIARDLHDDLGASLTALPC